MGPFAAAKLGSEPVNENWLQEGKGRSICVHLASNDAEMIGTWGVKPQCI
jgi:hypothetical protein